MKYNWRPCVQLHFCVVFKYWNWAFWFGKSWECLDNSDYETDANNFCISSYKNYLTKSAMILMTLVESHYLWGIRKEPPRANLGNNRQASYGLPFTGMVNLTVKYYSRILWQTRQTLCALTPVHVRKTSSTWLLNQNFLGRVYAVIM